MQQFVVPQFIDVEDKILGPITVRQFVLMVVGGIIIFLTFRFGDIPFFIFVTIIVFITVFLFGFLKINGSPFHYFLLNLMVGFKKPKLRIWNKRLSDNDIRQILDRPKSTKSKQKIKHKELLTSSRLSELSLIVDTRGEYKGED